MFKSVEIQNRLLEKIAKTQAYDISGRAAGAVFEEVLNDFLELTESEYGFIGNVLHTKKGQPYLKTSAMSHGAWDKSTRKLYKQTTAQGFEFHNINTLFGYVLKTGEPVIANDPASDPRRGGLPPGHPPLRAFLGVPLRSGERLVGIIGVANKPGGYNHDVVNFVQPLLVTYAHVIESIRIDNQRHAAEEALRQAHDEAEKAVQQRTAELAQANRELALQVSQRNKFGRALIRANRALLTRSYVNKTLLHASDESQLFSEVCGLITSLGGYRLAWVGLALEDTKKTVQPVAHSGHEEGYLSSLCITWSDGARGRSPTGTAIRTGKVQVVRNIAQNPAFKPWRREAVRRGYASSIAVPLQTAGKVLGVLNIYSDKADAFDSDEEQLLEALGDDVAHGVKVLRESMERRSVAKALEKREEELRLITDNLPALIAHVDANERYLFNNKAYERWFGQPPEQLRGKTVRELLGDKAYTRTRPRIKKALTGKTVTFENEITVESLGTRYISGVYIPDAAQARMVKGFYVLINDITERKRAEDRLRVSQQVITATQDAVIITDANQRIVDVNPAFCRIVGYKRNQIVGRALDGLYARGIKKAFYKRLISILRTKGHWQGELRGEKPDGDFFHAWTSINAVYDDTGVVNHYVAILSDITAIKQTEQQLMQLAQFDQLTGLANRMLFQDRLRAALARAKRHNTPMAVMYVDLDGFKKINDIFGHNVGDDVLVSAAEHLKGCVREEDTVSRLGGDEFAIILNELDRMDFAQAMAQRVVENLKLPIPFGTKELHVTGSVGVALFPNDGDDEEVLLRNADQAMYHAKAQGKSTYRFFNQSMNIDALNRAHLETDLRSAIRRNELFLEYQPKVDLNSGNVVGLEALVRWRHSKEGIIMPTDFIPFAEDSGLIVAIGQTVLQQVCEQIKRWHTVPTRRFPVAINISAHQLKYGDLVSSIKEAIRETGIAPDSLQLELTESVLMENANETIDTLNELRDMGIGISIDDFGVGYSSLNYLQHLPVDNLKIDRSFVSQISKKGSDNTIVPAIIALAHSMKLRVIAEGVETPDQLKFLRDTHCDQIQGFLVSKPVSAVDIDSLENRLRLADGL